MIMAVSVASYQVHDRGRDPDIREPVGPVGAGGAQFPVHGNPERVGVRLVERDPARLGFPPRAEVHHDEMKISACLLNCSAGRHVSVTVGGIAAPGVLPGKRVGGQVPVVGCIV